MMFGMYSGHDNDASGNHLASLKGYKYLRKVILTSKK
jgi:hypothetical protein